MQALQKKLFSVLFVLLIPFTFLTAQEAETSETSSYTEDEDWYWNQNIAKIEFDGLKNVKKSDLAGITASYIGEPFTEDNYSELIDRLYAMEYFENIDIFVKHDSKNYDDVLIVFSVEERPVIKNVSFVGNRKIRNGELKEEIKIKASDVYVESKVLLDERNLRNFYLKKGYTSSKVSHKTETVDGGVNIIFQISEGSSTVIREINFEGNTIVSDRTLRNKLTLKAVGFMKDGAYQAETLEQDKITLSNYYLERGYVDMNIQNVDIQRTANEEKQRDELTITFIIQEGAPYIYKGMEIKGNEVFSVSELMAVTKLKPETTFNYTKFQEDLSNIASKYYENGYMSNDFQPVPSKDSSKHEISYVLNIREAQRSHIENVIIKGNTKTKDYVITREIPVKPGDIFSRDKILNGYRNLMNLQYFSNVIPEPQAGSEDNLVNLVFTVEEQSTTTFNFGATFSAMTDPDTLPVSLYLKLENSNFLGEGKSISASTTISNTEQSVDLTYAQSWLWNLPISFSESLSFSHATSTTAVNVWAPTGDLYQKYSYMTYNGWSVSLNTGFSHRWTPNFAVITAGAGISNTLKDYIFDESSYVPVDQGVSAYANRVGLMNGIYTSLSLDGRDINYDPSKGWFVSERLAWYGFIPGLEKEFFLRSDTKLEGYLTLLNKPITENWNLKLVLAEYFGFSAIFNLPDYVVTDSNRLYVDGVLNGRGWTDAYKTNRGQVLFSNKLELRMPIMPGMIGVDLFYDTAAVATNVSKISSMTPHSWMYSFGPAIRILMPQFPLHLMFTWKYSYDENNQFYWYGGSFGNAFQFVLSFNLVNR